MERKTLLENIGLIKSDLVEAVTILFYEDKRIETSSFGIGGNGKATTFTTFYDYYPLCKAVINNKLWEVKGQLSKNNQINEEDLKYFVGMLNRIIKGEKDSIDNQKKKKINKI